MLVILVGIAAFVIDLGYLCVVRTQAQAIADAAALAGARGLTISAAQVLINAQNCANLNLANNQRVTLLSADVVLGTWNTTTRSFSASGGAAANTTNAVQVTVNLTAARNNPVNLFFASVFGMNSANITASAIAGVKRWDLVVDQDVSPSMAANISDAVTAHKVLLADFNQYSPTSDFGVVEHSGWPSTWASLQPVGPNFSTLNTTVGNIQDCSNSTTSAYNVYGGTVSSIAPTTQTMRCSSTDLSTGIQQALNMLTDPAYTSTIPLETSRAILISSDGQSVADPHGKHPSPTYNDAQLDRLAQAAATAAWAQGISVFVVFYYHGSATQADINLLQSLIRGQGTFTLVSDPTKLPASFNQLFMNNLKYELYQ